MTDGEHFEAEMGFAGLGWPQGEARGGGHAGGTREGRGKGVRSVTGREGQREGQRLLE